MQDASCVTLEREVAARFPSLALPAFPVIDIGSNSHGVGGRSTTLRQCLFASADGTFGWNWTRGATDPGCATRCSAPTCFADFSLAGVSFGVSPWGRDTGMPGLPVNLSALDSFVVSHECTTPGAGPTTHRACGASADGCR